MKKRIISALLCLALIAALLPASAMAASNTVDRIGVCSMTFGDDMKPVLEIKDSTKYTVSSIKYDQEGAAAPHSWVSATVTYKANDGYTFSDDVYTGRSTQTPAEIISHDGSTVTVRYTAWSGGDDVAVTQEMRDYEKAHASDTANSMTYVAVGRVYDPIREKYPDITSYHIARARKYPTMKQRSGTRELVSDTVEIYDLHAEERFSEGVIGQWYLIGVGNSLMFLPAACVTDVTVGGQSGNGTGNSSALWNGAPATLKDSPYKFAGGSGTREDPYLVATAEQLNAIRKGLDKHYKLIADIDLSSWGNWVPIGGTPAYGGAHGIQSSQEASKGGGWFSGSLDGDGHVISGMKIVDHRDKLFLDSDWAERAYGLFAGVGHISAIYPKVKEAYEDPQYDSIKNLGLTNYTIDLSYSNVDEDKTYQLWIGALSAVSTCTRISNCWTTGGTIRVNAGGGSQYIVAGGIVGELSNGSIFDCYNTSPIIITSSDSPRESEHSIRAGGIAGSLQNVWAFRCFNTADIIVPFGLMWSDSIAAGIATYIIIDNFPGIYGATKEGASYVKDCYNIGNMTANTACGIVAYTLGDFYMDNCYSTGKCTTDPTGEKGQVYASPNDIISVSYGYSGYGTKYRHDNGVASVSGDAWQYSSKLGRKVLKAQPEDKLGLTHTVAKAGVGGFTDVNAGDWFASPVVWAVGRGVTDGTSKTTFSPNLTCTRAQIITFIYRAAGSPEPGISNPFTDVSESDFFCKAAIWAYEKGMVSGTKFAGSTPCTRAAAVTYLWKYTGATPVTPLNNFKDVPTTADYSQAVAWAYHMGVTTGTSDTDFSPNTTCTRGQIVTFLYRTSLYYNNED